MLPLLLKIKLMTTAMAGWSVAASPVPLPMGAIALAFDMRAATPVEVKLYDENLRASTVVSVLIDHQGNSDADATKLIRRLFRCPKTHRERPIARKALMMLADVAEMYEGKSIEFVSVYRVQRGESFTSPHRDGRAIDFRIRGESLRAIRDYLWRKYTEVGVGWYPENQFIHMDTRPTLHDTSWTFVKGKNRYSPYWAQLARKPAAPVAQARRPGT